MQLEPLGSGKRWAGVEPEARLRLLPLCYRIASRMRTIVPLLQIPVSRRSHPPWFFSTITTQALQLSQRAMALYRRTGGGSWQGIVLGNLACTSRETGTSIEALESAEVAPQIARQLSTILGSHSRYRRSTAAPGRFYDVAHFAARIIVDTGRRESSGTVSPWSVATAVPPIASYFWVIFIP